MIAGHQHCDHLGGLDEVVNAGYNVRQKNYYNGSSYSSSAPAALVLQTEEGNPGGLNMSRGGYCVDDIVISTEGSATFTVDADGLVHQGVNERTSAGLPVTAAPHSDS